MTRTNTQIITGSLGALFLLAPWASSQQTAPQTAPPPGGAPAAGRGGFGRGALPFEYSDNEGWISLFDGETLNGWDGDTRFWSIKDGAIYVEPTCEKPTGTIYLIWKGGEPSDFMLKFESKGTGNVNGGVQFRSYMTADENVALRYPGRGGGGSLVAATAGRGGAGGPAGRGPGGQERRAAQERSRPEGEGRGAADAVRSARIPALRQARRRKRSGTWRVRSSISTPITCIRDNITSRRQAAVSPPALVRLCLLNLGSAACLRLSPTKRRSIPGLRRATTTSFSLSLRAT